MPVPHITPLPPAPSRQTDSREQFTIKADAVLAAQDQFVIQTNALADYVELRAVDAEEAQTSAADSASAAASSAATAGEQVDLAAEQVTLAAGQVTLAAGQVTLAAQEADRAEDAQEQAEIAAAAAGAAAGLPALTGNARKFLRVNGDENGVEFANAGQEIGDVLITSRTPGADYLPADGSIYLQASYPDLYSKVGTIGGEVAVTWTTTSVGVGGDKIVTDDNGVWIAISSAITIQRSIDDGVTWTAVNVGVTTTSSIIDIDTDGNGVWVLALNTAVGGSFMRRSIDNGVTWSSVPTSNADVYAIATDKLGVWVARGSSYMFRSTDNGITWVRSNNGTHPRYRGLFTSGKGYWILSRQSITDQSFVSMNNGITWMQEASAPRFGHNMAVGKDGVIACASGTSLYRSSDNGITWKNITLPRSSTNVATDRQGNWIARSDTAGQLLVSKDNGFYWEIKFVSGMEQYGVLLLSEKGTALALPSRRSAPYYSYDTATQFRTPNIPQPLGVSAYIKAKGVEV